MSDQSLLRAIYRVAERIKGAELTPDERQAIVDEFNRASGTAFDRATQAVAHALKLSRRVIAEKRAALDDIDRLITDLKREADDWQEEKEKD